MVDISSSLCQRLPSRVWLEGTSPILKVRLKRLRGSAIHRQFDLVDVDAFGSWGHLKDALEVVRPGARRGGTLW